MLVKKKIILVFIFLSISINYLYASNTNLEKVSLQLQWKHQFQFAGYYIAKEKGFYKQNGLDVTIKEFSNSIDTVDSVISNKATYGTGRPSLIINKSNGMDVVLLSAIFQSSPHVILTEKNRNIKTIEDFKNKRLMTSGGAKDDAALISMMFSQKIKLSDLKILKPSFNVEDLIDGKTDLMAAYISNEPFQLKSLGAEPVIFDPKDYGFDMYSDLLFTSKEEIQNYPSRAKRFNDASLKGWEYAFSHINETVNLILKKYNTQAKTREALVYEANRLKELAYYKTNKLGLIKQEKIEKIYDIYNLMGLIKNKIDFKQFVFQEEKLNLSSKEKEYLKKKKKITMCIDPNWMPFEKFDEDGKYVGMSADYYEVFQKSLSTKFEVIKTDSWTQSLEYAKKRKCDILSLAMPTEDRNKYLNFTSSYLDVPLVIATRLDVSFINEISDLKDKKIGITKGYAFAEILHKRYPYLEIVAVDDIDDGLNKVNNQEIYAYVGTLASVGYSFQKDFRGELKIAGKFNENWSLGIGVRNDDSMLYQILEKAVINLSPIQKQEILNKWISIKYEKGVDYTLVWKTIIFSTFVIAIVVYFYVKEQQLKTKIQKQKEDFEIFFENSPDGISIIKKDKLSYCNQRLVEILKYRLKEDILNIPFAKLSPKLQPDGNDSFKKAAKMIDLAIEQHGYQFEWITTRANGENFWMEITFTPMILENENVIHVIWRDIEDKKHKENLLSQQTKLASMGEMIGNISHQWRQPLSAISTAATGIMIQKQYNNLSDEQLEKMCSAINENAQYLSNTIDDFKNFIKNERRYTTFNLKDNINSFLNLVESSLKQDKIELILNLDESIELNGYPNELIQCYMNLFNNTKDALKNVDREEKYFFIETYKKDNHIVLKFKDNGDGIPKDILPKVFEPYFTTKHKSQGTGLGLHMTYNLITEGMKGTIVANNVNFHYDGNSYKGVEFTITL